MASFDEYKKKMNSKYGVKTNEKEEKKEEEKKPSSPSSGSSTKFQDYRSKMESKYNTVSDVDENYINTFIQDADKFMNSAQSSYHGMNWGNASSIYETSQKTIEDLRKRSSVIEQYLDRNKAAIDLEQYNSFKNYLKEFGKFASSSAYSFYNQSKFYSQFETQKSYDDYVAYQRDYEEKKNFDLDAGQKEIRDLENLLKEYELLVKWSVDGEGAKRAEEIRNQYGGAKGIKDLISQRTAYLNQAKRIQNGITLSGAAGNADFKDYSSYVSTKADGVWSRLTSDYGLGYEDLTYEYINNQDGLRDEIKQKHRVYDKNDDESVYESKGYDYLRDDEIAIYNYYYAKEGREKAEEYLDSIQEVLNQRRATSMYGNMEGKTALELAFQAVAGVDNWRSGMKNIVNNEDDYIAQSAYQIASGMVREDLADVGPKLPDWMGGASLGQVASDAISTTANMAPSILSSMAMNILVPGSGTYVGWAMLGGSAAGGAYQEALNEGYSKDQAKGYGLLVGASEIVMEKVLGGISAFGGNVLGKFFTRNLSNADTALKMIAKRLGGSMISEFSEEYLQEVLTPVFQNMVLGTDNEVKLLSPEALYSGMLGALTAGIIEGPDIVSGEAKNHQTGRRLQNAGISAERLAEIGKTFSADTVAYQLAGKVNGNTGAYTMGRLFNEIGATLTEQNISDITNTLVEKGMDRKTAKANARVLAAVVEGANFTDAEVAIIEGNDILAEAVRTIIDSNSTWYQRANGYNEALMALAQEKTASETSQENIANDGAAEFGPNEIDEIDELLRRDDIYEERGELYQKLDELYSQQREADNRIQSALSKGERDAAATDEAERIEAEINETWEQINAVEEKLAGGLNQFASAMDADAGSETVSESNPEADTSHSGTAKISAINNGVATVKMEDGSEVSVREAGLDPNESVLIETIASIDGISAEDANFILNTLKVSPGASAQMNSLGAKEAYKYGFYGFSQEHIAKHGVFANSLSKKQRQAIYQAGQNARQKQIDSAAPKTSVKQTGIYFDAGGGNVTALRGSDLNGLTDKQKAGVKAAMVLKKLGIGGSIYFFESYRNSKGQLVYKDSSGNEIKAPNGWYDKDGIHIDLNAGNEGQGYVLFTLAHELTHFIEEWSPKKYKVLADFLVANYEKGQSMDKLVRAKQAKLSEIRGEKISYDEAYSEVIADSMEAMLADGNVMEKLVELKAKDHELFAKMKKFFDNLAAKIRNIYKGLTPDSVEGNAVLEMKDSIENLQEMFAEALVEASENFQSAMESVVETDAEALAEDTVLTDGAVVTDGEGKKYSIKSMKADIAEGQMFEDLKTYCGWTRKQVNELKKNLSDLVEYMTPFRDILDMNETYGRDGRRFSPYKPNSDPLYKISMDFSTLCSKRLLTQYVIENLQLREGRPMSAEEQMAIRDMLNEYRKVEKGLQVACAMCYVEAARLKSPKQITKWMEDPGTQMKNYFADKNPEFANFIKEKQAEFKESRGYARNAAKKDMSAKDVRELNKIRPRLRSQYQLSAEEAKIIERAKALPGSTYLTAGNLASLSETDPVIYAAYTAFVRTATRSKSLETDEPYYYGDSRRDNGNGIIVSDSFIEAVNRENGMRFSSWSDWRIQHLLDYITAVIDNSVRGAAMHGYTKFGEEVRVLGKTGMMFNMSGVAGTQTGLNEDGSLSFSPTESIDANEAIQLREEFPETAGLQCIGVGDDHITALLRSDIIDYVIPYHTSGLNAALRRMANIYGWKDYTTTQHAAIDKSIKFENAVDQEHWHEEPVYSEFFVGYDTGMTGIEAMRASAERYKQMCKDRGLKPKFEQFANEENYWKLLIDRKMINQKTGKLIQQKAVTPTFDFGTIKEVVDRYVRNYDSNLEARALNHIVENWDSIPQRIKDLKKQGGTKAKKIKKAADTLANQTLAAQPAESEVKHSDRDFTYQELTAKSDLMGSVIKANRTVKLTSDGSIDRAWVVKQVLSQCESIQTKASTPTYFVNVPDIGKNVEISGDGIRHGFIKFQPKNGKQVHQKSMLNARASLDLPQILQNSIEVNRSDRGDNAEVEFSHVLIGVTAMEAPNGKVEYYAVRSVVESRKNQGAILTEANVIGKLHAMNTKKIGKPHAQVSGNGTALASSSLFGYSVADLLNDVKNEFDDTFSNDVYKHFGMTRRSNKFSDNLKYSDRDSDSVSNRSLLANAFESAAQDDIERSKIQEYKGKIGLINAEERKLQELNQQIKDLSFAKGPKDTAKIRELQFEARQTANRINTYDKQLLRLEASKPLQDVLTREKKMAYQRAEKKGKEALAAYKEKAMKTQREMMDRYQASRKQSIENRHRTEMRHKIKDVVNELNQYLLHGTKDRHVPDSLQRAVAEALDAVNMDTVGAEERIAKLEAEMLKAKTPEKIQEISRKIDHIREMGDKMNGRLKKLKDAYDELLKSPDMNTVNAYDEVIHNKLESVIDKIGNTALRDMSLAQLEDVYDMYRMVLTAIRDVNKSFKDAKKQSISTRANAVMAQVEEVGGKHKESLALLNSIKKFFWNNLKPVYAFEHIGSITLTEAFKNVRAGEDVWALDITEARDFYLEKVRKYKYESWDLQKQYRFQSTSGMDFSLNLEQILSLYAYSKRDQAADHLKYGGIVFDESTKIIKKTKLGISLEFNPTDATAYNISEETLAEITSKLTDEQKAFADEMQDYLSTVMGGKGNEVSMAMYDIKLFKDKNYFPLKSAQQFMEKAREQQKGEVKIKNSGFSKETVPHAKNPIVLTPFMEVWTNHVNEMSMYHAFVLPLEDFYRIYNYKTPSNNETLATEGVNQYIQNAYGRAATAYIDQLLKDLNGGARTDSTTGIINKMMGLFKKGAVFASLSVVVQQPSAIARAAALVDTKYFIGPKVDHKRHKALWNEVKQYAPVAMIKEMGYFDTNMGKSTQDFILGKEYSGFKEKMKALVTDSGYRDEALSKAPALADELAWCSIWEAVKRETMAKNPGLQVGSEEFLQKVGERFTEVIVKTQVYDSVLSRSANMRSKDTGMKMATAFMAEPTTSINMITDALLQGKRGNRKYARAAIGAVIASQILNSILVSFVYAGRDDDEDETYLEKYIGTLTGEIVDSLNPAGYIPFIKDIQSIVQGYDVERSDMAVISDLWNAWQNLSKDSVSAYRKVEGFVGSICQIFGLPVKNIMRDVRGIYQTIMSFRSGQQTTKAGIGYAVKSAVTGEDVKDQQQLYEAILNGDKTQIARVKSRFKDQSAINSAIRKALRENDPRIAQAAQAKYNGDLDEYMRLAKAIIAEKHFSQDDVVAAINAEINALDKGETTTSAPKASGLFKTADFAAAIAQGDQAMANAIKTDIISTAQKNGKTQEEAEKSFISSVKSDMKELFMEGKINQEKAINALMTYCDMEQEDAEQVIGEWEFKVEYGFGYDERIKQFKNGNISASELKSVIMSVEGKDEETANTAIVRYSREAYEEGFFSRNEAAAIMTTYGGLTAAEAEADLQYIDVKLQFPDTYVDDAWVEEYYNEVQASGISIEVFVDYRNKVKGITGSGKKEGRMAVIDSMPISNAQKDALYYAEGWAASRIYEAPWH